MVRIVMGGRGIKGRKNKTRGQLGGGGLREGKIKQGDNQFSNATR